MRFEKPNTTSHLTFECEAAKISPRSIRSDSFLLRRREGTSLTRTGGRWEEAQSRSGKFVADVLAGKVMNQGIYRQQGKHGEDYPRAALTEKGHRHWVFTIPPHLKHR